MREREMGGGGEGGNGVRERQRENKFEEGGERKREE